MDQGTYFGVHVLRRALFVAQSISTCLACTAIFAHASLLHHIYIVVRSGTSRAVVLRRACISIASSASTTEVIHHLGIELLCCLPLLALPLTTTTLSRPSRSASRPSTIVPALTGPSASFAGRATTPDGRAGAATTGHIAIDVLGDACPPAWALAAWSASSATADIVALVSGVCWCDAIGQTTRSGLDAVEERTSGWTCGCGG